MVPETYRPVMHLDGDAPFVDDIHWEYRSSWAETSGKIPVAIDTGLEKISNRPLCMAAERRTEQRVHRHP